MASKTTIIVNRGDVIPPNASHWRAPAAHTYNSGFIGQANSQIQSRPAGTYSNLRGYMSQNSNNSSITLRLIRNNVTNGNQAVSWSAGTTGAAEDLVQTDSINDGEYLVIAHLIGGTGSACISIAQVDFLPSSNTLTPVACFGAPSGTAESTTHFNTLTGINQLDPAVTEASVQTKFKQSCTLKNLRVAVVTNTRSTANTYRVRKNGSNGNGAISQTSTGTFEDVTGTDSIVSGDLVCISTTTGTGTGTLTPTAQVINIESTSNVGTHLLEYTWGGGANFGTTLLLPLSGYTFPDSPEARVQTKFYRSGLLRRMTFNINTNNVNGTITARSRINGNNANPVVSVNASTTGNFDDDGSFSSVAANDLVNFQIVSGGSSGSFNFKTLYVEFANISPVTKTSTLLYDIDSSAVPTFLTKTVTVLTTGGATQDITFTPNAGDPDWTPKVAIVQWNRANTSQNTFQEHASVGMGFTDGTNQRCVAIASEDNQARGDSATIQRDNALICALNPSGTVETVDCIATFNSWLTNGMRINWTDAPAANFNIDVLFLGGEDITNAAVGTLMSGTTTGDKIVNDKTFKADVGLFITGGSATINTPVVTAFMNIGAATGPSAQWSQGVYTVDNPVTMSTRQNYSHSHVVDIFTTSITGYATFSSFEDTGFVLNVGDAFAANTPIFYLIIKGGSFDVGNATEPASATLQTITTNKDTKAVMVFGVDTGTAGTPQAGHMQTWGMGDGASNHGFIAYEDQNGIADSIVVSITNWNGIYGLINSNATATSSSFSDTAYLNALSSTGFVMSWGLVGSARPYRYITFGTGVQLTEVTKTSTYLWDLFKEVTDVDTFKWDVIAEIVDTNTLKFDVTVPVTDTNTFLYDVLQEITTPKSLTLLHDILQAIPKTSTLRFDVYKEVLDTNTLRFDVFAEVLKTNSMIYEVLQEVAKTQTFRYDIFMEVVKAYSLLHNVTMEIATAKVLSILYNISVPVTDTNTLRHDILQEVTDTNTLRYDVIAELIKTATFIYNVEIQALTEVTKTFTTRFNVDVEMLTAKVLTLLHNISQEVTTSETFLFDVFAEVTKTGTLLAEILQEVTDSNTLRYDVTVNVEAAKILIHDILQSLTKSNTIRFDVTVETLAKQLTLLHNIIGEITKSETVRFNVDNIMTKTSSFLFDIYEGLAIIKSLNIMFNVDQEFTTEPRTLNFNVDNIVEADTALPYNIDVEVAKANILPYEILEELTKTGTLRFDTISETVRATTMIFNVLQQMVKTGTFIYDIETVNQVIKTLSMIYNVDKVIQSSPRVFNWNITREVERTRTFRFDVTVPVEAQFDILYSLFQQVIKGTDIRYDINKAVTKLFIGLYNISQAVTRTRTFKHNIQQETTKTGSFIYDVTVPMLTAAAFNIVYDVMVEIESQPKTLRYDIIQEITKTSNLIFSIYNAVMAAIKTTTLLFNIDKTMSVSKTMRYDVTVRVDKSIRLIFEILQQAMARKVFRWNMQSQVTKTRIFKFNVTNELRTESTLLFNILNTVAKENELLFEILVSRTKQFKTRYAIQHEVAKSRTLRHNISQFVESAPKTFNWDLLQETEMSGTLKYNISQEMAMRARLKWEMLQELVKQNDIMFNLLQEVPEVPVTFRFDIIAQTTKLLKLYYDIDKIVTKAHSLVYSIIPTTVTTPKTALHERLLDYIITQYNIPDPPKNEILVHEWYNGLADITIDSIFLTSKLIPDRSTLIYKERVYRCAIHLFYRVVIPDPINANNPTEYVNVINHISNILSRARYNLYYDLGYNVYEARVVDAFEIPDEYDPQNTEPVGKIRHYRWLIDLYYQKLIT